MPPGGKPTTCANSLVLRQDAGSVPFWHASSHNRRLSMFGISVDVRKHSVKFHSRHIEPVQSPFIHNCVPIKTSNKLSYNLESFLPSLQRVLFAFGAGGGHCGDSPLHVDDQLQSDSDLHCTL